jgi:hypothetical protein
MSPASMLVTNNKRVWLGGRVRIVGEGIYKGKEGVLDSILNDRQNRHTAALIVLDIHRYPTKTPFLAQELERIA